MLFIIHNPEDWSYWVKAKTEKGAWREVGWSKNRDAFHCHCYDYTITKNSAKEAVCRHIKLVRYYRRYEPFNIAILIKKIKRLDKNKFFYL